MRKNNWNILSTRPLNKELIQTAAQQNIQIDCISFIHTEALKTAAIKERIEYLSAKDRTVVFTSMNAVEAVNEYLPPQKTGWKIYCIGHTTQQLVSDIFGAASIKATADDASKLADIIIRNKEKEIVFFCGDQRRKELPGKLQEHHVLLEEVVVYKTILTKQAINSNYDGILFYSPSAVQSFFSANKPSNQTIFFAIGETTARAIKEYGSSKIVMADKPGKEALVQQMITYFTTTQQPINH